MKRAIFCAAPSQSCEWSSRHVPSSTSARGGLGCSEFCCSVASVLRLSCCPGAASNPSRNLFAKEPGLLYLKFTLLTETTMMLLPLFKTLVGECTRREREAAHKMFFAIFWKDETFPARSVLVYTPNRRVGGKTARGTSLFLSP